ncbi:MAG TPA: lytic transglycosylase domain-containing protein [Gammaproteobacteria bacterium]|nr:lytic transglycosylase domain-containing protein [Gammaproteobacteria bacterium]
MPQLWRSIWLSLLLVSAKALADTSPVTVDSSLREALVRAITSTDSFENRYVAEVWLMDMSRRLERKLPDPHYRLELLRLVHYEATRAGLRPELVLAVIEVESNFNRWAISSAGARGLMQVMPFWLKEIGRPDDDLFHVATNLRFGCTILQHYLDRSKGNLTEALARYNGSYGRYKYPNLVYKALDRRWYAQ